MPHILFLMSDTGGGHRAAARAIEAALQERRPGQFSVELVDLWKEYTPFPFNRIPDRAHRWIHFLPSSFSAMFWIWDRLFSIPWWSRFCCRLMYARMKRLYAEHPADLVVCVHAAFVRPAVYALRKLGRSTPFLTVITDYAWPQVLWYDPQVTRCLVPTDPAYQRGLSLGLKPAQMILTGPPVHPKFAKLGISKEEARARLGWETNERVVLIIAGGDGTGPIVATARAIDQRKLPGQLVVVAGRNERLKAALEAVAWNRPARIYGFVDNMEMLMRASDLLITKAGPATITEAALLSLPVILNGALKYQESPNVDYVVNKGAGMFSPGPKQTADSVQHLFGNGRSELEQLAHGISRLAQPNAVWNIADEISSYA